MKLKLIIIVLCVGGARLSAADSLSPAMRAILTEAADRVNTAEAAMDQLRQELAQALATAQEADRRAAAAEAVQVQLKQDQFDLLGRAASIEQELENLVARAEEQAVALARLRKEKDAALAELAQATDQRDEYAQQLRESQRARDELRRRLTELQTQTRLKDQELCQLTSELEAASAISQKSSGILSSVRSSKSFGEILEEAQKISQAREKVSLAELQKAESDRAVAEVLRELEESEQQVQQLTSQLEAVQKQVTGLEAFRDVTKSGFYYVETEDVADMPETELVAWQQAVERLHNQSVKDRLLALIRTIWHRS